MRRYSLVNDTTGEEYNLELDPDDAEESRDWYKRMGWTLIEVRA